MSILMKNNDGILSECLKITVSLLLHILNEMMQFVLLLLEKPSLQRKSGMKKSEKHTNNNGLAEIPPFDFEDSKPNRFAAQYQEGISTHLLMTPEKATITLEPDVAEYFPDSESVNAALRTLIAALATIKKPRTASKKTARTTAHI